MSAVCAGVARATITPPVGIALTGFAGRGPAEGVYDDLTATALALEAGGQRAVVIALDLLYVTDRFTGEVRAEIERRLKGPLQSLLLCCSHTHYGPFAGDYDGSPAAPDVEAYLANLRFLLAGAAQEAFAKLRPVQVGFGTGESYIGINRRERRPDGQIVLGQNPDGPCDREVRVIRLDADDKPLACLVNFACHPVSPAGQMRQISPDWVGAMRRMVETTAGAPCLFLQGAAGNINPVEMRHSFEPARRLGAMLGGEVLKVFEGITDTAPGEGLAASSARLDLPAMAAESVEAADCAVADLEAQVERLEAGNASSGSIYWAELRLKRATAQRDSLRTGAPLSPIHADLFALRFGDIALVTAPAEIFTETGMAVKKRSALPRTCYVGYTNGTIGYVPVPAAYPEGGYEVTHACRVGPEAAGMIEDASLELLEQVSDNKI